MGGKSVHGMCQTKVYKVWQGIIDRCNNPKNKDYLRYGGRGIKVCPAWLSFQSFFEDMGDIPPGKSIDRINNDKGYSKDNCRWATRSEQQMNKQKPKNSSSEFRGVFHEYKKSGIYIRAAIRHQRKIIQLGYFATEELAARAYDKKASELRGHNARLNFPVGQT